MNRAASRSETNSYMVQMRALRARISVLTFSEKAAAELHEEINQLQMALRRSTRKEDAS